jgi:ubiquinone/menaquinone biosynthesis C-methylase UbiE
MTWQETIAYIRTQPDFQNLVRLAYFDEHLSANIERFAATSEFSETVKLMQQFAPNGKKILDIGCGNGISAINFAKIGYDVTALEPDKSDSIGAGAVRILKQHYNLENIKIIEDYAENINFPEHYFDIVYIRQAMHHAHDLKTFIAQAARVLRPNGLLITVRDHVIFDEKDKNWFLDKHPLHKFYGGENAFKLTEYQQVMQQANLTVKQIYAHFDTVINYFPAEPTLIERSKPNQKTIQKWQSSFLLKIPYLRRFLNRYIFNKFGIILDEKQIPGRMYSFIAIKN